MNENLMYDEIDFGEDSLDQLKSLVDILEDTIEEQARLEETLDAVKEKRRRLEGEHIPDLVTEKGLSEIRLKDGRKVIIGEDIKARIPAGAESRQLVVDWIKSHGGAGLIHDQLTIEEPSEEMVKEVMRRGEEFTRVDKVNTQSFCAFLRELLGIKKGFDATLSVADIPKEAGPYLLKKTKIERKK